MMIVKYIVSILHVVVIRKKIIYLFIFLPSLFLLIEFAPVPLAAEVLLKKPVLDRIIDNYSTVKITDFRSFVADVESFLPGESGVKSIKKFLNREVLNDTDAVNIYRLLGLYCRLKYRNEILGIIDRMVALPTAKNSGKFQHKNWNIIKFGKLIESISRDFGLKFRNYKNYIFEVSLQGTGKKSIGIYTHCDVVPAETMRWILPDGTKLNPYKMKIIGGRMYGRGVLDDKSSIAAALFALKTIRESGIKLKHSIRLIIETTEETSGRGFAYYKKQNRLPEYNVVLDNRYPVVVAEKGFGLIYIKFAGGKRESGAEIMNITGGAAINQIPAESRALIKTGEPGKLKKVIADISGKFISKHGGNFSISTFTAGNILTVTIRGISAHSSEPDKGVNPVSRMFCLLHEAGKKFRFRKNRYTDAAKYVYDNYGTGYHGEKMGIAYSDNFMGPLTVSVTKIINSRNFLKVGVNLRIPRGNVSALKKKITNRHDRYKRDSGFNYTYRVYIGKYFMSGADNEYIKIFLNIFTDITGIKSGPISSAGGTTAKQLPNGLSFGPCYPGEKFMMHIENEYKELEKLYKDMQMVTEMILRIGNY